VHGWVGERLFRWRSYAPLAALLAVVVITYRSPVPVGGPSAATLWVGVGLGLGALGLVIRGWAIGVASRGTSGRSTRAMRADTLSTTGPYSLVRHPLYLGNLLLWLGVAAVSGRPEALAITSFLFAPHYGLIMKAEDRFLRERFGDVFDQWSARTPALVPRPRHWTTAERAFDVRAVLARDHHALYAFIVSTCCIALARAQLDWQAVGIGWWIYLACGTVAFSMLWLVRRHTKWLGPTDEAD